MKPSIVITGGSGLLALNWALAVRDRFAVTLGLHNRAIEVVGVEARQIELDDPLHTLEELRPAVVIHAAGMTNVEACEDSPALARHVNVNLAANVAGACAQLGLRLVHISTDHLFSGSRSYATETDPLTPTNVYGRTKAEAEGRVLDAHAEALVVRTNFFGWGPPYRRSFSDVIITNLRARRAVTLFQDVFYTPLLTEVLVDHVHELLSRNASGIFHVAGDERVSKYQFGLKIAKEFCLDPSLILAGKLTDREDLVRRPSDMSLSNQKARRVLGRDLGNVDEQLQRLRQQEKLQLNRELLKL